MKKSGALRLVDLSVPTDENGKVHAPPRRVPNAQRRSREYLTEQEVEALMRAARQRGRWGQRDAAMILIAFRHGLRVRELVELRWADVDLDNRHLHVRRRKNGKPAVHPLTGQVLRELRKLQREADGLPFVFVSERDGPLSTSAVRYMLREAGAEAALPFPVHPHMLRHACGFKLANDGRDTRVIQDYLGHKNIAHTVRYTDLAPGRFSGLWGDW
jgi:type 1 fimbriae regulatory protein FimB/type 1 fimbriae regulatory protein FimE